MQGVLSIQWLWMLAKKPLKPSIIYMDIHRESALTLSKLGYNGRANRSLASSELSEFVPYLFEVCCKGIQKERKANTMTRSPFGLCLSAYSLMAFSAGAVAAQTPNTTQNSGTIASPDLPSNNSNTSEKSEKSSKHSDSSGMLLLGAVLGGAALMGGSHGGGSSSTDLAPSAVSPQVIYTPGTGTAAAPVVVTAPIPKVVTTTTTDPIANPGVDPTPVSVSVFDPASPVVTITVPTAGSTTGDPTVFTPEPVSSIPDPGLFPTTDPLTPSVPEPTATVSLGVGALMLGMLVIRAHRKSYKSAS